MSAVVSLSVQLRKLIEERKSHHSVGPAVKGAKGPRVDDLQQESSHARVYAHASKR